MTFAVLSGRVNLLPAVEPAAPATAPLLFQVECFADMMAELPPLIYQHWREIALNQDAIKLDPDWEKYLALERAGCLFVATVREEVGAGCCDLQFLTPALKGYWISFVYPHLHYKNSLQSFYDVYYVDPAHRGGRTALRFFRFVEAELKARGVQKLHTMVKLHRNRASRLWEKLGYTAVEVVYTKVI